MKDVPVREILQQLITHLREVSDMMKAVQITIEGVKIHDDFNSNLSIEENSSNYKIIKDLLEDANTENLSIQDNTSFMLGSIHKRIGKYKQLMKKFTDV